MSDIDYNKTIGELISELTCDCGRCMKCNVRYYLLFDHNKEKEDDKGICQK